MGHLQRGVFTLWRRSLSPASISFRASNSGKWLFLGYNIFGQQLYGAVRRHYCLPLRQDGGVLGRDTEHVYTVQVIGRA